MVEHIGLSVVIFRGGVLLVAALTAGMSIFLGWQLFRSALFSKSATDEDTINKAIDDARIKAIAEAISRATEPAKTEPMKTDAIVKKITDETNRVRGENDKLKKEIETKGGWVRVMAGVAGVLFAIYGMAFLVCLAHSQANITENLACAESCDTKH